MHNSHAILLTLALVGVIACVLNLQSDLDVYNDGTLNDDVNRELLLAQQLTAITTTTTSQAGRRPNVIYIQHESLSGSIMLNTIKGKANTPYFQDRMANDPDFYVFEYHRTGSGSTIDAMPALMTGCLPYTKKGVNYAQAKGKAIGYEFAENGYATASFSSRKLDDNIKKKKFSMLYDILVGGMDKVEDALGNPSIKIDNNNGSNDLQMLPLFEEWLTELDSQKEEGSPTKPFYAQFYNFNNHHPYLHEKDMKNVKVHGDNYYSSLKTTDNFLEGLFGVLARAGQLENTIIVGSSDHGEDPFRKKFSRTTLWTSHVLHAAAYIYYPRHMMPDEGMAETLRMNTKKLTQTLDMYPTVRSILHGGSGLVNGNYHNHPLSDPNTAAAEGCMSGIDLTTMKIPEDRVTLAMNIASGMVTHRELWAINTKDLSLYHRKARSVVLGQGRNNNYILKYGSCTKNIKDSCRFSMKPRGARDTFRRVMVLLRSYGKGFYGGDVKKCKPVEFFVRLLGGEKVIKATAKTMAIERSKAKKKKAINHPIVIQPHTNTDTIFEEAPPKGAIEPPILEGLGVADTNLVLTDQKGMSGWSAPSCESILLFMPSVAEHATIENQLNSYVLAAMAATFMNLSMVILDAPKDFDGFKKSQFGCSKFLKKAPPGLSGILKSPKWLSSNCAVPCQQSHGYSDWDGVRQSSGDSIPAIKCANNEGHQSNVFVMGGDDVHRYFETHLKDQMAHRPSPVAYDWASRLGASAKEAATFSQLNKNTQVWDYLGALVARSNLLQFQPWIFKDVASYMKQSGLQNTAPVRKGKGLNDRMEWAVDAIQVQRDDELLSNPQALQFVSRYWDAHGGYDSEKHNHIPIDHYLSEYLSQYKCSRKIRRVYIATSDKKNTKKEISKVGSKAGKGKIKIGCTTFQFKFPPALSKKDSKLSSCAARYSRTVTSIAHFIIFSSAKTFIGDFNSDLGRLVRTFRLKLNEKKSGGKKKPVLLSRTKAAFGKILSFL